METVKRYESLHQHSFFSNLTYVECICSPEHYAKKHKELGMTALSLSEHGHVLGWHNKFSIAEKYDLKYIHSVEAYVTATLDEKLRDNYHCMLIAKNQEGFYELNKLMGQAARKDTNNFYYVPRIGIEDLENTSDNIIILSGCLGGVLAKPWSNSQGLDMKCCPGTPEDTCANHKIDMERAKDIFERVLKFAIENKHRFWLEVQPHADSSQINWNKKVLELAKEHRFRIVGTLDAHASSAERDETRHILKKGKKTAYEDEDAYNLYLRTYDEVFQDFKDQKVFDDQIIEYFLNQSCVIADMCEHIELDDSIKYPHIYENSEEEIRQIVRKKFVEKGLNKLPNEEKKIYTDRIVRELNTFKDLNCFDFFSLKNELMEFARSKGINAGPGRGSVTGSICCYLMGITKIDSIKSHLSFERFMDKDRAGLPDIDTDFIPSRRREIFDYLLDHDKLKAGHIIAFGTLQIKSAITDIGRGLGLDPETTKAIKQTIVVTMEEDEYGNEVEVQTFGDKASLERDHPELMGHVNKLIEKDNNCIVSLSLHPCGIVCSSNDLESELGYYYIEDKKAKKPVRCVAVDMSTVDRLQYIKMDILGLSSVQILSDSCELANIDYDDVMPESLRNKDEEEVWKSIGRDPVNIFQFNGRAGRTFIPKFFSDKSLNKIFTKNPNVKYIDLLAFASAVIRPAGNSFREKVAEGNFIEWDNPELDDFFSSTMGALIFQEQVSRFFHKFAGLSLREGEALRRGVSKKKAEIINKKLPEATKALMKELLKVETPEKAKELVERFKKAMDDAKDYGFSENHSVPYSYNSYAMAWLRYHYPLEFYTSSLNQAVGKEDKIKDLVDSMRKYDIKLTAPKIGMSGNLFTMNKDDNTIALGLEPIKGMASKTSEYFSKIKEVPNLEFADWMLSIVDPELFELLPKINELMESDMEKDILLDLPKMVKSYQNKKKKEKKQEVESNFLSYLEPNVNPDNLSEKEIKTNIKDIVSRFEELGEFQPSEPQIREMKQEIKTKAQNKAMKELETSGKTVSKPFNKAHMKILLDIGFFDELKGGKTKALNSYEKLLNIKADQTVASRYKKFMDAKNCEEKSIKHSDRLIAEAEHLGAPQTIIANAPNNFFYIYGEHRAGYDVSLKAYHIKTGRTTLVKTDRSLKHKIAKGTLVFIEKYKKERNPEGIPLLRVSQFKIH